MTKNLFLLFLLMASLHRMCGQDSISPPYDTDPLEKREISDAQMERYANDADFDYTETKNENNAWNRFTAWLGNLFLKLFEWIFGAEKAVGMLAGFLRIVPYLLLGVLLFILIKFFLKVNANAMKRSEHGTDNVILSEEERILKNEDIWALVQKALAAADYRLAIRYYYLLILQKMSSKELIDWQPQKTNDDYLRELKADRHQKPFRTITRLYDYIWYGSFSLNEEKYRKAEKAFSTLHKNLNDNA